MTKILAINGSYRDDGITDQVVDIITEELLQLGAEVEAVNLRDYPIEFCLNCRECTQSIGEGLGECVLGDGMKALIEKIEDSDGYIFASPTNFGSVTAVYKRFMERLIPYAFWPWGMKTPKFRKANNMHKRAVLVSSCAAPGFLGHLIYNTKNQLKYTAKIVGANVVGSMFTGLVSVQDKHRVSHSVIAKAKLMADKLMS